MPGEWDPVTETSNDAIVIAYSGRGVFDSFKIAQAEGVNTRAIDQLLIAPTSETVADIPDIGHRINGFDVVNVQLDPAGVHCEIQLRNT